MIDFELSQKRYRNQTKKSLNQFLKAGDSERENEEKGRKETRGFCGQKTSERDPQMMKKEEKGGEKR